MTSSRRETALCLLLYGAMAVLAACWILRPYNDADFFWHLKTGEWIWQHRELPEQDPFNSTSQSIAPERQRFVLSAYWLSQIVYYGVHARWGIPGIVALKVLIVALLVLALVRLRRGDRVVHAALVLTSLPLLSLYALDRPQAFSFVFFAALLLLLERERSADVAPGWRRLLLLPLLMLAWANMHGGHAIGQAVIATYLALEGAKFLHRTLRPAGGRRYRRLLIAGIAGLAASLANPNSYHALAVALAPAANWVGLVDYLPAARFLQEMDQPLLLIFFGALVLAVPACLFGSARPDITSIAVLVGTAYAGLSHFRHIPYFMIAAVPVLGAFLSATRARKAAGWVLAAGSIVLTAHLCRSMAPSRETVGAALRVDDATFPVRAADFVRAKNLRGNLYNIYFWGGYLLWRLGPERKVFVDGRGINPEAIFESASINMAFARPGEATPHWKRLLQRHGVDYLIIPRDPGRKDILFEDISGLLGALLADPDWIPVFADDISLVFVLNTPEHRDVIADHGIPKDRPLDWWLHGDLAWGNLLARAGRREESAAAYREAIRLSPRNSQAWHNLGCVLGEMGRLDEAIAAFEETLRIKPDHPSARGNLELTLRRRGR